jgi:DNA-binding CsgD family transcriptional regulator
MVTLTRRQKQIVRLISLGCTIEDSARIIGITFSTADSHLLFAKRRLGISKSALITRFAVESGISPIGDELTADETRRLNQRALVS